jgi:hypothetical protein
VAQAGYSGGVPAAKRETVEGGYDLVKTTAEVAVIGNAITGGAALAGTSVTVTAGGTAITGVVASTGVGTLAMGAGTVGYGAGTLIANIPTGNGDPKKFQPAETTVSDEIGWLIYKLFY